MAKILTDQWRKNVGSGVHKSMQSLWQDPEFRARRIAELKQPRGGACSRNPELVRDLAAQSLSLSEIARRLGTNKHRVKEYLQKHNISHHFSPSVGPNNPQWTGGRIFDKQGYILLWRPDHPSANSGGYVREHRLVMEQKLGRPLLPTEVVHHGPGGKQDNSPENLSLYDSNGKHLAETLAGQCPKWSQDGKERILKAIRLPRKKKVSATQTNHKTDDSR